MFSAASADGGATFAPTYDLYSVLSPSDPSQFLRHSWRLLDDSIRAQGDSIYVATHLYGPWSEPGGSGNSKRLAVFTSTDFGATFGAPDLSTLVPAKEDASAKAVLAVAPNLVCAGAGVDTYWTDYLAFLRVGSTGSAPALAAGPDLAVTEGQETSVTADFSADDASAATATIDWGDGTVSSGIVAGAGTTGTVSVAHAYGTYGTYHATAHLAVGGQSAEDTFTVTVADVAPVVSAPTEVTTTTVGLPWRPTEVRFSDAGWNDALSATIDWGDGTVAPAALRVTSPGGTGEAQAGSVDATHTYSAPGAYTVSVTVDDGADETAATFSVVAEVNHDPVADAGGPYTSYEGEPFSLDASASSDPDLNAPPSSGRSTAMCSDHR